MSKVYTIVAYRSVSDPAALAAYSELAGPAIRAFGGRIVARGLPLKVFEAGLQQRTIIIEWDSLEKAAGVYEDPAYLKAMDALGNAAERDIRILEAVV
jgi:uncharacterized protein (DUF1330 family)